MEQGIDFDDEENDFNAINSSVMKRKLRIESDSESEEERDVSSNVKNNKLIESEHSTKGVVEDDDVLEKEHAMEGVEEDTDISDKADEVRKSSRSEDDDSKSRKRLVTANSDSENELTSSPISSNDKKPTESVSKRLTMVDSDSEDNEEQNDTTKDVSKKLATVHTDSEDEHSSSNSSTSKDEFCSNKRATVDESNEKSGELISENNPGMSTFQKSRLSALYDSESSEDESRVSYSEINTLDHPRGTLISKSKKPKLPAKPKEKKMTAKQALQQRQEITSESQRMMRESRVSLPYHIPKARSIKEFLQNRPKFASPLLKTTCQTPPSLAMKMSVQQLEVVVKKLEERNKELEKFYESESESEDETLENEPEPNEENTNEGNDNLNALDETNNQNEEKAKEDVEELDVTVNLPTSENNQNEENLNEIDENVNAITEPSAVERVEENHGKVDTIQTEEMVALVMPDANSEAEISNTSGLELSIEIMNDNQNKKDLEEDSDNIQNKSTSILKDTSTEIHEIEEILQKKILEDSGSSMVYNFNLDDVEESEDMAQPLSQEKLMECDISVEVQEKDIEDEHFQRILKKYEGESVKIDEKKLSILELVKQKYGDTIPCLKGAPGDVIDLDDTGDTNAITELKERFIKHVAKKHIAKHKVHLDVINLSQGEIHKETVAMSVGADEEPVVVNETPGSKLRKLKKELETQMAQRRFESWKQRQLDSTKVELEEKADYETEAILDDEEEAELTDGNTTDEEIENDEKVLDVDEESKDKCTFLDDQAEEDDDEENADSNEVDELIEDQGDSRSEVNENKEIEEPDVTTTKKPRRLLIIGNSEHSDSDDEEIEPLLKNIADDSLSSTDTAEADELPPNLPFQNRNEKTPLKTKSQFSFLTPVQQLTGLQSLNSGSKFLNETSPTLHSIVLPEPSPLKESSFSADEDEMNLHVENIEKSATQKNSPIEDTAPTTQDLLNICSGSFSMDCETQNQANSSSQTNQALDNNTCITLPPAQPTQINLKISEEVKNLDEDNLITQLLNEDELEQFKKKFTSPLIPNNIENQTNTKSGRLVIDSSDEENEDKIEPRRKPKKKLDFSDDESDEESEEEKEEEIDLHENISEDEEESSNVVTEYDSEENEIEVEVQEKKDPKSGVKSREFFENEAELSESDWDSEDEDEKGLDVLETEQGDADVFDEAQVRNDLEKIHMRRVLDQDNQEIKMLQELLLEDGELHGTGRQKQFRWRNIDDMDNEEVRNDEDAELYLEEDESEEQWRKVRHEREMFLKSKTESSSSLQSDSLTSSENDSLILKLGEEALRKGSSKIALEKSKVSNTIEICKITKPFAILNTRGSFLARSDQFLNKLAEINKVATSVTLKNTNKKIVFETRSIDNGDTVGLSNGKKRKASEGTPSIIKKLRLSSNLSPNINSVDKRKKLFN